jgi:DNA-binding MarR family transcriptional regulator
MSLEEELKSKFTSEHQKAMVNILFTASWLYNNNAAYFKRFGITPEQFNVLRILRGSHPKPMRLADISQRMIDKSSNCTRLVEKLRQKALVSRELCKDNRRQVDISIKPKGLDLLRKIDAEESEWLSRLKGITKADAQTLNAILNKLRMQ